MGLGVRPGLHPLARIGDGRPALVAAWGCALTPSSRGLGPDWRLPPPPRPLLGLPGRRACPTPPASSRRPVAVDVWSGNHPFYSGAQTTLVTDEGRLAKFREKYEGIDMLTMLPEEMAEPVDPNASDEEDDVYLAPPPKSKKGAGKSSKHGKKKK